MKKNLFLIVLIGLVGLLGVEKAAGAVAADLVTDFSITKPQPGPWYYGYTNGLGQTFTQSANALGAWHYPLPAWQGANSAPLNEVAHENNNSGNWFIHQGINHLGPFQCELQPGWPLSSYQTVARWVCPEAGAYYVYVEFAGLADTPGTTTDVHLLINSSSVWDGVVQGFQGNPDASLDPFGDNPVVSTVARANLAAGDTVDASVGDNGSAGYDQTGVRMQIGIATGNIIALESEGSTDVAEQGPTSDTYNLAILQPIPDPNVQTVTIDITTDGQVTTDVSQIVLGGDTDLVIPITVTAVDDALEEGPHAGTITHTVSSTLPSDPNWNFSFDVTVNITDNDLKGISLIETDGSTNVAEPNTADNYSVVLLAPPSGTATITISTDADVQVEDPNSGQLIGQLIFNVGNWNVPQTVIVRAIDDTESEGPEVSIVTHTASGGYDGFSANLLVNVADNERYCGDGQTYFYAVDYNHDCYIDIHDLVIFVSQWLKCSDPFYPNDCEINPG